MTPTIGRIVHFRDPYSRFGSDVKAAIVTRVFSDDCVNLAIITDVGVVYSETSVVRCDDASVAASRAWSWPPIVQ